MVLHVFSLDVFAELLITHKISDRRHCMPQMVLVTWHSSTFFNHRAVCKCTHVHFLFSQAKTDWQGYWEDPACPPPSTPRTLSSCLSAGNIRIPRSGCFSCPLQCKDPTRHYHDVYNSRELVQSSSQPTAAHYTCTTLSPHLYFCKCKGRFSKSASKPSNSPH